MAFILDAVIIAIIAAGFIIGWNRGFVKSAMSLLSSLIALVLASVFTERTAAWLNGKYVYPFVSSKVEQAISGITGAGENALDVNTLLRDAPESFTRLLNTFGIRLETMKADLSSAMEAGGETLKKAVIDYIAAPASRVFSTAVAFLCLFLVFLLVLKLVSLLLEAVMRLPVLKTMNAFLGLVFGGIAGILIAWGFSAALARLMPTLSALYPNAVSEATVQNTVILRFLAENSIITVLNRL